MIEVSLITLVVAFGLAAALTPVARRAALGAGLVARVRPDRLSQEPMPYGGGLAIAAVVVLVGGAWLLLGPVWEHWNPWSVETMAASRVLVGRLLVGAAFFFGIGLLDDRYEISPLRKLFLQFLGALMVVQVFGIHAPAGRGSPEMTAAASTVWIVLVVNAYNLFDHADGIAAAVGAVAMAALGAGQLVAGEGWVAVAALTVAGALAGFLIYNLPPAKLYLGDAGAGLVGFLLAALTMLAEFRPAWLLDDAAAMTFGAGALLLAAPLFDMVCVLATRIAHGKNPLRGDATSHLAHRMLARGVRPREVVVFAATVAMITGGASILMTGWTRTVEVDAPALMWPIVATVGLTLGAMLIARRRPKSPKA
jgi:UDP-GlcNAc:undecaprenyl-phosphate/decaprenyl-phosphate GlcNAc-1-phosphate transferase